MPERIESGVELFSLCPDLLLQLFKRAAFGCLRATGTMLGRFFEKSEHPYKGNNNHISNDDINDN